jgi:hypothetical protein
MDFTKELLESYLEDLDVPLAQWGTGDAKTIEHLLCEIDNLECSINGVVRRIQTVALDIFCKKMRLREDRQVFVDGRVRRRNFAFGSVGEKMRLGEDLRTAIMRALDEELGFINPFGIKIVPSKNILMVDLSRSYPGLVTFNYQARMKIYISPKLFDEKGFIEVQSDKTTYFVWEPNHECS